MDDPDALDALAADPRRAVRRPAVHRQVPALLPRAGEPAHLEGQRAGFVAEHLGFTAAQTVAFGDGENDLELLGWAGYGVCVENGNELLKAQADWLCPGPEEQGVAQAIEAYLDSSRMIDLKAARNDPDTYRAALARKGAAEAFDAVLEADERWRALVPRIDELRGKTKLKGKPTPEQQQELQQVKEELKTAEEELAAAEADRDRLALRVPNLPSGDVPDGSTEDDVEEIRRVGEPRTLDEAREHLDIGSFEMERAARMSGARFGYWVGDTARLALALYRLALDRLADEGLRDRPPARARPRGGADRDRRLPVRRGERLRAGS